MEKKVTLRVFFTTIVVGLWQFICWVCKAFDPRNKTKFWRVIWAIWTAALVLFIGLICYAFWQEKCRSYSYEYDKVWLSNNVYCQRVYNGEDYIFNTKINKKTLTGLHYYCTSAEGEDLAVFFKEGKRGYFNVNTGEVALPAVYDKAWIFSEGVAMVVKDDSLRLINNKGEYLASFWYSRRIQCDEDINYVFHDELCVMNTPARKFGLIDKEGAWILPAEYESICQTEYGADTVYRVSKKDMENGGYVYGVMDNKGKELIPCIYKTLSMDDSEGIFVTDNNHYQWKSDLHGNLSDEPLCYNVTHLEYTVKQTNRHSNDEYDYEETVEVTRFAPLYSYTSSSEGYMGLMDANGHRITPPIYRSIKAINDNLYCCGYDDQFDNAVLLNAKGLVVK